MKSHDPFVAIDSTCPECSGVVRWNEGELVCSQCGLVVDEDLIDRGPEWRSFAEDGEQKQRTGAPLTPARHDRGLSTEIGRNRSLSPRRRKRMDRLRRQHRRAQTASKRDRNRRNSFFEIRQQVSTLSLPDMVRDTACSIFRSAQNADLLQGRSLEGFAAASVYAACRVLSVSRTKAEILGASKATAPELDAAFDAINRELAIPIGPPLPIQYIPRFATELELDAKAESFARKLAIKCQESGLSNGRNPAGIAAACLYTAGLEFGYSITQREAATVADVSPVTVRKTYKQLDDLDSAADRSR